jgi:hypothetical protein
MDWTDRLYIGALAVGIVVALSLIMVYPTMWICNYLFAPSFLDIVFGIGSLTFWKALWLNVFLGLVFSSRRSSCKCIMD